MKMYLYDERRKDSLAYVSPLGESDKLSLTKRGELNIRNTDLLYSLRINLSKKELRALRDRLNEILGDKKEAQIIALREAESILESKR